MTWLCVHPFSLVGSWVDETLVVQDCQLRVERYIEGHIWGEVRLALDSEGSSLCQTKN